MSKDTLYLTNSNPKFKAISKDRLFYNQFEFAISFQLEEVTALRELDHNWIDIMIERRRAWREIGIQRHANIKNHNRIILGKNPKPQITDEEQKNLHDLADVLLATGSKFKLVTSQHWAWVYTNDMVLINEISELPFIVLPSYSQAQVSRPQNTIKLKKTKYAHRTYFKSVKLTDAHIENLKNFFDNQKNTIRLSPALTSFFSSDFSRTMDHYFIDHNSEQLLTMMSLIHPGLIRKTMSLIPA